MSIPKIIHNTFKNENLPKTYKFCQTEIKKLHPDFEYRFYTDHDMDEIMKTEFSEYYKQFSELPRMIMKIDMFRYFLMYQYGGIYTDMDYLMLRPFDILGEKVVIPCNREDKNGNPICLGNCIFASQPKHPYWKSLMDTLFTIDRTKIDYNVDKNIADNILGTGPMFVFDMWEKYSKTNNDIYVCKKNLFHPQTNLNHEYLKKLKKEGCYGMHICTGAWRNRKL
jgi:mannosyltransferase OCH1-like enzyme